MNLDRLWTDEMKFKFDSGLLSFEIMSDAWTADQELELIQKIVETLSKNHPKLQIMPRIFRKNEDD